MAIDTDTLNQIWSNLDGDEMVQLALDLTALPSPTGEEAPVAEFMLDWFAAQGLKPVRQEVETDRLNAIGILAGSGGGPSLALDGHMDVGVFTRHIDIKGLVPPREDVFEPYRDGDLLFGFGMDNMKSGIAAIMMAAALVKRSGIELAGDLIIAGVVGEIARASVDQYQGRHYRSKGIGTRYMLTHGILSDYAIVADTSHFGMTWAECGVLYAKISTHGRSFYTPFTRRPPEPETPADSENAIIRMLPVIQAVERWAAEYQERTVYPFAGGEVRPKVSIGSIAAGAPFNPANSPNLCSIYIDIRTPPAALPIDIQRELVGMLKGFDVEVEFFLSQRGYEHQGVEPLVSAITDAHTIVAGGPPPTIDPAETSMWTDTNLFYEAGIPAVKFGLGAALRESKEGELWGMTRIPNSTSVHDLLNATKIYAAVAARVCSVA